MRAQETLDATIAAAGSKTTYAGATTSVAGWIFSSEFAALCGIIVGVVGLLVNYWFKRREDIRQQAEHEARMRALQK